MTGPLDRYFTFLCEHCKGSTPAMVRASGTGSASDRMTAQRTAYVAAGMNADRAVWAAACPRCGALHPAVVEQFRVAAQRAARQLARRTPIAAAAAAVVAVALAIPAIGDLKHSAALGVVALSGAAAAGALLFAIFSRRVATRSTDPSGVWFSWDPSGGTSSWFPAQNGPVAAVQQPSGASRVIGSGVLAVAGITALSAFVVWTQTFRKIYVVSAEGTRGDLVVRIDGVEAGRVTSSNEVSADVPFTIFKVRTSSPHQVVVVDADGEEGTFTIDPASARYGWVAAPHGRERGLCLASITWYYGTEPIGDQDHVMNHDLDIVRLPHSFDHFFTSPPKTIELKSKTSETRTSLRAFDCAALENDNFVPYREAMRRVSPL
jgi:hypothetical protein